MLCAMQTFDPDWLVPEWPTPPSVRAVCTTRNGGGSAGNYASFNLGTHVGDDPQHVAKNRMRLGTALAARPVFLNQTHGVHVQALAPDTVDGIDADAAITSHTGVACTVMVADCLPVLLCDAAGTRVAVAHAGWRGLLGAARQGVLEQTVAQLRGADSLASIMVWLGPCIGPHAFEVGDEVRDAFVSNSADAAACFVSASSGKWLADLPGLARQRLMAMGVTQIYGNDGSDAWCTVGNPSRFFSHRRDRISGRQAACIWRVVG